MQTYDSDRLVQSFWVEVNLDRRSDKVKPLRDNYYTSTKWNVELLEELTIRNLSARQSGQSHLHCIHKMWRKLFTVTWRRGLQIWHVYWCKGNAAFGTDELKWNCFDRKTQSRTKIRRPPLDYFRGHELLHDKHVRSACVRVQQCFLCHSRSYECLWCDPTFTDERTLLSGPHWKRRNY